MRCTAVLVLAITACTYAAESYTTKYDNVNIDNILGNSRLLTSYLNCLLGKTKCNEDGNTLKSVIPDALITNCAKCNDKQKESIRKVIRYLVKHRRADYDALVAKYDPQGIHRQNYQHYLDELH